MLQFLICSIFFGSNATICFSLTSSPLGLPKMILVAYYGCRLRSLSFCLHLSTLCADVTPISFPFFKKPELAGHQTIVVTRCDALLLASLCSAVSIVWFLSQPDQGTYFTGSPGIGKTSATPYFIVRFLMQDPSISFVWYMDKGTQCFVAWLDAAQDRIIVTKHIGRLPDFSLVEDIKTIFFWDL